MAIEEPPHTVEVRDGAFEIRAYAPKIVAEVTVEGDRGGAANRGFRPLADYIFGGNQPRAKIAMTAPVIQQPAGQKIAMTAPVIQQPAGAQWVVQFVMPAQYTMETLPAPNNPSVRLKEQPAVRMGVVRFSGIWTQSRLDESMEKLLAGLAARGEKPVGPVTYAFYDPPWTPPFMRRNEVMVALEAKSP